FVWKQLRHFADELVEEFEGRIARGIHRWIEDSEATLDLVRAGRAGEFRMSDHPGRCVSGHVELRQYAHAAIGSVGDDVARFVLRVEEAIRAHAGEAWEDFALDAESLVIGEVPVEDVHLGNGDGVDLVFENVDGLKMPRDID